MVAPAAQSNGNGQAIGEMEVLWHQAEGLARNLPPLTARAEELSLSNSRGTHGRRKPGTGDAFWQFRQYQPGDAMRDIDWRRSARSDALFVRQNEWETAQNIWIWRDASPSMAFQSELAPQSKVDRATVLALALAILLVAGGERVAHLGGQDRPAGGRFGARRLFESMAHAPSSGIGAFPAHRAIGQNAHLVVLGDFLDEERAIEDAIARYADDGVKGHLVQVLDPVEESFPFLGRITLHGLEGEGDQLLSRAEEVRDAFTARLTALRQRIGAMAGGADWTFTIDHTDGPAEPTLLALAVAMGMPFGK